MGENGFSGAPFLTRRQLLQRMGLVGGSSMVMGAMSAWDLMGAPIAPRPDWQRSREGERVLILGAGVSGLVTGYELGKLGYDYQILEARDRVGGLNWSVKRGMEHTELGAGGERQVCEFDEGEYINAGPWRLPNAHHGILGYCKELGVRLDRFIDDNTVMFNEDPALGPLAGRKIHLRELKSDLWGSTAELLAKALDQGSLDRELSVEDKERMLEFLVTAGYLNRADHMYQPNAAVRGNDDKYDLSLLLGSPFTRGVRSLTSGTGGPDPVFQPTGGMMEIPLAFQRVIGDRLTLRAEVTTIRQTDDGVRVVYRDTANGEEHELSADYLVCCLPMAILKKLDINFSPEMATAVEATSHSSSSKMGLQMARRFWEEDDGIYGGHLQYQPYSPQAVSQAAAGGGGGGRGGRVRSPLPSFSYPSNDYGSKKGVLLGFYGNPGVPGLDGTPLLDAPVRDRIEYVLTHASRVHPQIREEFESAYVVWWPRVKYNEGAWANARGGSLEQLVKGDRRIYIGSSVVSGHSAWQEGAVEAAWMTVDSIHQRVSQD